MIDALVKVKAIGHIMTTDIWFCADDVSLFLKKLLLRLKVMILSV